MKRLWVLVGGLFLVQGDALAHHSFAMFDASKSVTIEGTFRKAELMNPHSWYWVDVLNADGSSDTWGAEGGGPSAVASLSRPEGMTIKEYFAPGQKVTMTLHPLKDGRKGGQLVRLEFADGRVFEPGNPPPGAAGGASGEGAPQ